MAWNHKGFEIDMQGAFFATEIDNKRISLSSLNGVKKAIDKHLDAKAQEVTISLPVVIRISKGRFSREAGTDHDKVIHCVITGVDAETKKVVGITPPAGWGVYCVLPDTPENTKALETLIAAEEDVSKAKRNIEGSSVGTSFVGVGRKGNSYSEAIELLKKSYERANKGEGTLY